MGDCVQTWNVIPPPRQRACLDHRTHACNQPGQIEGDDRLAILSARASLTNTAAC